MAFGRSCDQALSDSDLMIYWRWRASWPHNYIKAYNHATVGSDFHANETEAVWTETSSRNHAAGGHPQTRGDNDVIETKKRTRRHHNDEKSDVDARM